MKKTIVISAIFVGLLLFGGGYSELHRHLSLGQEAPSLAIPEVDSIVARNCRDGRSVLINFWISNDGPSRNAANVYRAWLRRNPDANLDLVGVNFDESEPLFREMLLVDSLEPSRQFHVSGDTARAIINSYGLEKGYGAVLVGPDGKISAYNPTEEDLDLLVGH